MFKKLFGGKEEPKVPPQPQQKKFNQMNKEEMKEVQKNFKKKLNVEMREIDRQITRIEMAKKKSEEDLKKEIKKGEKGDNFIKQTYAKQVLQSRIQRERYMNNKGKVQGLQYTMDNFFADIKLAQTMNSTSDIMKTINQCMSIKELQASIGEMQKEMAKMGIIQEMMEDVMEASNEDSEYSNENEINDLINNMEKGLQQPKINNLNQNQMNANQPMENQDADDFDAQLAALKN